MKAFLLAAGVGERMRPLTDRTPKPLLMVGGAPLLEYHIRHLVAAGISDLVINVSHLAQQIIDYFGDGSPWGATIAWSLEGSPLETAGGIIKALPLLGDEPFLVVNGDIWTDYPFAALGEITIDDPRGAFLVMVDNPEQHPRGDFALGADGLLRVAAGGGTGLTYSGLGLFSAGFFEGVPAGKLPLRPLLDQAIENRRLQGGHYRGQWVDVGTPERLAALNTEVSAGSC